MDTVAAATSSAVAGAAPAEPCGATEADLACARCGYNLRGLPPGSNCPECGLPVAETVAAAPLTAWLPGFRRGLTCFAAALVALPVAEPILWSRWYEIYGFTLNRDGVVYLAEALILSPAAWFLTRPAPFLRRDPARMRPWLLGLLVAVGVGGLVAIALLPHAGYWFSVVLLSTYGLVPPAFAVALWLLYRLVLDAPPLAGPRRLRWVAIGTGWVLLYSLLGPAVFMAMVSAARVHQLGQPFVPHESYLPRALNTLLDHLLGTPAIRVRQQVWLVALMIVVYCRFRLRRGVLPTQTAL